MVGLAVIVSAVFYRLGKRVFIEQTVRAQVVVKPFTIEQVFIGYDASGKGTVGSMRTTALRSDGSMATIGRRLPSPENSLRAPVVTREIEMADGRYASLIDSIAAKATGFFRKEELALRKMRFLNPPAHCAQPAMGDVFLREEVVAGARTFVVERRNRDGSQKSTMWLLAEHGCELAQRIAERRQPDGSYRKVAESKLLYLTPEEPDPKYFDGSDAYRGMPPSAIREEYLRSVGMTQETCPECFQGNWAKKDAEYHKRVRPE